MDGAPAASEASPQAQSEQPPVADTTQPKTDGTIPADGKPVASPELFAKICAEHPDLDPSNPVYKRVLQRIADKEAYIERLQSAAGTILATKPDGALPAPTVATVTLADLESQIGKEFTPPEPPPAAAAPPATTPAAAPQPPGVFRFGDIGDGWKDTDDAYTAVNEAWAAGDLAKVHDVETAIFRRRAASILLPAIEQMMEDRLDARLKKFAETDLGDVIPQVRQTVDRQRDEAARADAISRLRSMPEFKDIDAMLQETGGPPIRFNGREWPNTPLNQIFAANEGLLRMRIQDPNPEKARRLTHLNRYALAARLYKQQQTANSVDPAKAQALLDAGAALQQKSEQDRTRQAMNAGTGATGTGAHIPPGSLVQEINNSVGAISIASLLK